MNTRIKFLNVMLVLTSLIVYMEWGSNNKVFLLNAEAEVLTKLVTDPGSVVHPFIIIPLAGQLLLLITLLQRMPSRLITYIGFSSISLLILFVLIIGILSNNLAVTSSALPFFATVVAVIISYNKVKRDKKLKANTNPQV